MSGGYGMRSITEIIVHCTATQPNWWSDKPTSAKVQEIRRWHKAKGWADIGYHYLIDRDGTVHPGRPLSKIGAHVQGHNTGTIGVSLFGGHGSSADDDFSDNFTIAQNTALRQTIASLRKQFPTITKISGHNEYAAKACPGFRVSDWLDGAPMASPAPAHRAGSPVAAVKPVPAPVTPDDAGSLLAKFLRAIWGIITGKA